MKRDFTLLWGVLLIVAGALFLVQTLVTGDAFTTDRAWAGVWAILFGGAGLTFGWVFLTDRSESWWAAIPATTFLGLSILTGVTSLGWQGEGAWMGAVFLAMIGLGFWLVYAVRRDFWWAIIPGGVLFTLAVVVLVSIWAKDSTPGAVFFFGLALTFGLLALLPTRDGHIGWAIFPAIACTLLGATVLFSASSAANYIWPLALIVMGLWLLYRQFRGGQLVQRR